MAEGIAIRSRWLLKWASLLLAMALAASACTDSVDTTSTLPQGSDQSTHPYQQALNLVNEALGGAQAVQDFAIWHDVAVQTSDGEVSVHAKVLELAMTGAGEPVRIVDPDMGGGVETVWIPVDSLRGYVVSPDGEVVPSLSVEFGVIEITESGIADARAIAARQGDLEGTQILKSVIPEDTRMLVQIVTANYTDRRTHLAPEDRVMLDVSAITGLAPDDVLTLSYVFGQTLPGSSSEEAGLSPHGLFAYRWSQGLVSILATEGEVGVVVDSNVTVTAAGATTSQEPRESGTRTALYDSGEKPHVVLATTDESTSETDDGFNLPLPGDGLEVFLLLGVAMKAALIVEGALQKYVPALVTAVERETEFLDALRESESKTFGKGYFNFSSCGSLVARSEELASQFELGVDDVTREEYGVMQLAATECERLYTLRTLVLLEMCTSIKLLLLGANDGLRGGPAGIFGDCEPPPRFRRQVERHAANVFGDPHMTTLDGLLHSNQAVGEFLLFENETGTIQIRTARVRDDLSLVSAVGLRLGDVTIHLDDARTGLIRIDGEVTLFERGVARQVGSGAGIFGGTGWLFVWPDGTIVQVHHPGAMAILLTTPERSAVGLLGDGDGNPDNDFKTRSGTQLDRAIYEDFERFYSDYVDSWRITDAESLLHYEEGESTATFTIEGFPVRRVTSEDLDPVVRAEAEATCLTAGIETEEFIEACMLDVGATGDPEFAYSAYVAEGQALSGSSGQPAPTTPDFEGDCPAPGAEGTMRARFHIDGVCYNFDSTGTDLRREGWVCNNRFNESLGEYIDGSYFLDASGNAVASHDTNVIVNMSFQIRAPDWAERDLQEPFIYLAVTSGRGWWSGATNISPHISLFDYTFDWDTGVAVGRAYFYDRHRYQPTSPDTLEVVEGTFEIVCPR